MSSKSEICVAIGLLIVWVIAVFNYTVTRISIDGVLAGAFLLTASVYALVIFRYKETSITDGILFVIVSTLVGPTGFLLVIALKDKPVKM